MDENVRLHYNSFSVIVPVIWSESTAPKPGAPLYIVASSRAYMHGHPVGLACAETTPSRQCLGVIAPQEMQPRFADIETMNIRIKLVAVAISGAVITNAKLMIVAPGREINTFDYTK